MTGPRLSAYDDRWPALAAEQLARVERALEPLDQPLLLDHIGSTSVPGLPAKPFLDLQLRLLPLPDRGVVAPLLETVGFRATEGSRSDSPGVHADSPRGSETVPAEVWTKQLYVADDPAAILHVRRTDSPWGRYTVLFRDWLRAHPDKAALYAATKQELADRHADDRDFDDYTRAKTAYFDRVQAAFERWGRDRDRDPHSA